MTENSKFHTRFAAQANSAWGTSSTCRSCSSQFHLPTAKDLSKICTRWLRSHAGEDSCRLRNFLAEFVTSKDWKSAITPCELKTCEVKSGELVLIRYLWSHSDAQWVEVNFAGFVELKETILFDNHPWHSSTYRLLIPEVGHMFD
jgi:hypothetical protein